MPDGINPAVNGEEFATRDRRVDLMVGPADRYELRSFDDSMLSSREIRHTWATFVAYMTTNVAHAGHAGMVSQKP